MKKLLSILLVLAMLLAFTACAKTEESTTQPAETAESVESAAPAVEETAQETEATVEEPEEAPAEEVPEEEPEEVLTRDHVSLPICDELTTITCWYTWPPVLSAFSEGPGTNDFWKEVERRTNVHLECLTVNTESAETEFNLMVLSGEYPDLGLGCADYYQNPDQAVEDEVFLDLAPYLDETPNFKCLLMGNEDYQKALYTDNGAIIQFPKLQDSEANNIGPVTRGDWLEDLGMDVPQTYDQLEEMLLAFKNEKGSENGMLVPYTGFTDTFSAGYGVPASVEGAFYVKDGEVKFTGLEQDYYDFVTLMTNWYSQGIIDHEFLTRTTTTDPDQGLIFGDNASLWTMNFLMFDAYINRATTEGFAITALPTPVKEVGGGIITSSDAAQIMERGYVVFATTENLDVILKYVDYGYSEEGSFLYNYGLEGVSFEYDENGDPYLLPCILQNEMGLPSSLTLSIYVTGNAPYLENVSRCYYYFTDAQLDAYDVWKTDDYPSIAETYPSAITLSVEDSETYSTIMSDISTYMEETIFGIVVGNGSVDDLPAMGDTVRDLNIQDLLDMMQEYYDNYKG